jgi:anaerobic magnesium-protoporphyrin IX monomethyl ester cyclase
MKKILFINPLVQPRLKRKTRPVGLAYIMTAVKKAGIKFDFIDMYAHNMSMDELQVKLNKDSYDICAIGSIVTSFRLVRDIASILRRNYPSATIIAGNSVASSIPELLLRNTEVDIAVTGEGDVTIVNLLRALIEGTSIKNIKGIAFLDGGTFFRNRAQDIIHDLDQIGFPDWDLFSNQRYNEGIFRPSGNEMSPVAFPLSTSRGCPYHCTFCYHVFMGLPYRRYSEDMILKEFKRLYTNYSASIIQFSDELSFLNISDAIKLTTKLERMPFNIHWSAVTRPNLFSKKDILLIKRMRDAGCMNICFALENASQTILDAMGKKVKIRQVMEQIIALQEGGVFPATSVIFGYPEETPATIRETFEFCNRFDLVPGVGFLQPLPGTPIYDWAVQQGYIKDELEYLLESGDREILHINLTKIPTGEFIDIVVNGISDLARKKGLEEYSQFLQIIKEYDWKSMSMKDVENKCV